MPGPIQSLSRAAAIMRLLAGGERRLGLSEVATSLDLAKASAARTEANRADYEASSLVTFDSTMFQAWFTAYVAGNKAAERVAEERFRPVYLSAFKAWLATHPFTNPNAPACPGNAWRAFSR